MSINNGIDFNEIKKLKNYILKNSKFKAISNSVQKNGISDAMFSTQDSFRIQNVFNNEVDDMPNVTDQKQSGRCWIFAGLNVVKTIIKKTLKIKNIELSESYLMFYDKLEKTNTVLEYAINNINEPFDSRIFRYILGMSAENDGGYWHYFVKLVKKYGICPKEVMGETYDSSHSDKMNELINTIITKNIALMYKNKTNIKEIYKIKENTLKDVYKILAVCIGIPVDNFTFDFEVDNDEKNDKKKCKKDSDSKNKKKEIKTIKSNPKKFAREYLIQNLDDYIILTNFPSEKYPFMQTYTKKMNINMIENTDSIAYKNINVEINEMKNAVIKSIKDNSPVWFGCDVTIDSSKKAGYLASEIVNARNIFDIDFSYDKTTRVELLNTECNHAMTFSGVHLDKNNKPVRWKVQNSWGEDSGKNGYFIMTDSWFTDYVYECVINKKYLNENIIKAFEKNPIILEPWNALF